MAKVAVHTNNPAPYCGHYVHSLAPLSQGVMPLTQLLGRSLRLLPSISVVLLFREHRRYFYVNDRTSASQWDFPTEEEKDEDLKGGQDIPTQTSGQGDTKASSASTGRVTGQSVATIAARQTSLSSVLFNDFRSQVILVFL